MHNSIQTMLPKQFNFIDSCGHRVYCHPQKKNFNNKLESFINHIKSGIYGRHSGNLRKAYSTCSLTIKEW